jgi:hypothetical protein
LKKKLSILLLIVFSLAAFKELTIYGLYTINKETVIEFFCINKGEPELKCDGKCHLNAELSKVQDKDNEEQAPVIQYDEITYILAEATPKVPISKVSITFKEISDFIFPFYYSKIFHPPCNIA